MSYNLNTSVSEVCEVNSVGYITTLPSDYIVWSSVEYAYPDRNFHVAHMVPTCVLSAPSGPNVGPMNFAFRVINRRWWYAKRTFKCCLGCGSLKIPQFAFWTGPFTFSPIKTVLWAVLKSIWFASDNISCFLFISLYPEFIQNWIKRFIYYRCNHRGDIFPPKYSKYSCHRSPGSVWYVGRVLFYLSHHRFVCGFIPYNWLWYNNLVITRPHYDALFITSLWRCSDLFPLAEVFCPNKDNKQQRNKQQCHDGAGVMD